MIVILGCRSSKRIKNKLYDNQLKAKYKDLEIKQYLPENVNNSDSESDKE